MTAADPRTYLDGPSGSPRYHFFNGQWQVYDSRFGGYRPQHSNAEMAAVQGTLAGRAWREGDYAGALRAASPVATELFYGVGGTVAGAGARSGQRCLSSEQHAYLNRINSSSGSEGSMVGRVPFTYSGMVNSPIFAPRVIPAPPVYRGGRAPEIPGGQLSALDFLRSFELYLGRGYREISPGRWLSTDGLRQMRFGADETRGPGLHGHYEVYDRAGGSVIENRRVEVLP